MKSSHHIALFTIVLATSCSTLSNQPSEPVDFNSAAIGQPVYQPMLIDVLPPLVRASSANATLESMVTRDTSITDLLLTLFKDSDINLLVDDGLESGTVTLDVKKSTVEEVFEGVLRSLDVAYEWDGGFLRITDREAQTFDIDVLSGDSGGGDEESSESGGGNDTDVWSDVETAMTTLAGDDGSVLINRTAGTVHVEARPSRVRRMREFIATLERRATEQVSIEARILEVRLADEFRMGVNWSLLPNLFNTSKTGLATGGSIVSTAASAGGSAFSVGFLEDGDISLVVDALESMGQVRVLSSPRISTMNNVPANLSVIDQIPVIDREIIDSQGGLRTEFDIRFVDAGVTVAVTPQIGQDGMITVRVAPQVTEQTGTITTPDGLQTEPILSSRSASTVVRVADGQAIVIGGLRSTRKDEAISGVPVLAQIPWLGQLFRSTVQTKTEVELMVIVVPRRLDRSWMHEEVRRGAHRLVNLRRGFRMNSIDLEHHRREDWSSGTLQGHPVAPVGPGTRTQSEPPRDASADSTAKITRAGLANRLVQRAQDSLDRDQHSQALALLEQAIALHGTDADALTATGILLARADQAARAAIVLDRALAIAPEHSYALAARANLALSMGAAESGRRMLGVATQHDDSAWLANNLGAALLLTGDHGRARAVLAEAAKSPTCPPEALANLAFAQHATGDRDSAMTSLERALSTGADPRNPRVHALQRILATEVANGEF